MGGRVVRLWRILARISVLYILAVSVALYVAVITLEKKIGIRYDKISVVIYNNDSSRYLGGEIHENAIYVGPVIPPNEQFVDRFKRIDSRELVGGGKKPLKVKQAYRFEYVTQPPKRNGNALMDRWRHNMARKKWGENLLHFDNRSSDELKGWFKDYNQIKPLIKSSEAETKKSQKNKNVVESEKSIKMPLKMNRKKLVKVEELSKKLPAEGFSKYNKTRKKLRVGYHSKYRPSRKMSKNKITSARSKKSRIVVERIRSNGLHPKLQDLSETVVNKRVKGGVGLAIPEKYNLKQSVKEKKKNSKKPSEILNTKAKNTKPVIANKRETYEERNDPPSTNRLKINAMRTRLKQAMKELNGSQTFNDNVNDYSNDYDDDELDADDDDVFAHQTESFEARAERYISRLLKNSYSADRLRSKNVLENEKVVLLFTTLWSQHEWTDMDGERVNNITKFYRCPINNCVFTYNKQLFNKSDAVVFHAPDQKEFRTLKWLNKYGGRSSEQRWVFFTSESPESVNTPRLRYWDGLFNLTMTYDSRSDIKLPYGRYEVRSKPPRRRKRTNYAKGKNNKAVWFVSNCDIRLRKWLARELGKYIEVDVGGTCEDEFENWVECPKRDSLSNLMECRNVIGQYKYYLSFESRFCKNYITEKYWENAIANGVVPIVLGGANYSDPINAIPGSFIDAQRFKSVKELGEYLQMLNKDDRKYNKYFEWRKRYRRVNQGDWPYTREWVCSLCAKLNQNKFERKFYNLSNWWNKDTLCNKERSNVMHNQYVEYWRSVKIANNITDDQLPIDDDGNTRWEVLEDMFTKTNSDNKDSVDYNDYGDDEDGF